MRKSFELKTQEQIRKMRVAGLLTAKALGAVRAAIKPGVTTLELDQIAEKTIRDGGGIPNFQLVPGYFHTICASVNSTVVHGYLRIRFWKRGTLFQLTVGRRLTVGMATVLFRLLFPGLLVN